MREKTRVEWKIVFLWFHDPFWQLWRCGTVGRLCIILTELMGGETREGRRKWWSQKVKQLRTHSVLLFFFWLQLLLFFNLAPFIANFLDDRCRDE